MPIQPTGVEAQSLLITAGMAAADHADQHEDHYVVLRRHGSAYKIYCLGDDAGGELCTWQAEAS